MDEEKQDGIDLTKKSVIELKAMVYDEMSKLDIARQNIKVINNELAKRGKDA